MLQSQEIDERTFIKTVEKDYFKLFWKHLTEHCIIDRKCRSDRRRLRTVCNLAATLRILVKITTSSTLFFVRNAFPSHTEQYDPLCVKREKETTVYKWLL